MRKIFYNKNGDEKSLLIVKVVKMTIAIICVLGLMYLLVQYWYSASRSENYKKAGASLNDVLYSEIQRINSGGVENPSGILVPNPSGWEIIGFTENTKPNLCLGENCLCICDVFILDSVKSQATKCDKEGVCKIVENLASFNKIKIPSTGIYVSIKLTEKGIEIK